MRESGIYTPESLDAVEADARSFDQERVSGAIATLPPEIRTIALNRINQGEDPFSVLSEPGAREPGSTAGFALVDAGMASSPYANEAAASRDHQDTRFQQELTEIGGPRSLADGSLANSTEWQDLLGRMRESGIYTPESLDAVEADARSFDQERVSGAIATLPPEIRTIALNRINQGEDPFSVLQGGPGPNSELAGSDLPAAGAGLVQPGVDDRREFDAPGARDGFALVDAGMASSPYANEAGATRDHQMTQFQQELTAIGGPRSLADGSLANSTEWQDLLGRMRESGIYTPESLDAVEAAARSFDQERVSGAIATLPPEIRTIALNRINQGEDPFSVLQGGPGPNSELAGSDLPGAGAGLVQPGVDDRRTFDAPTTTTPRPFGPLDGATVQPAAAGPERAPAGRHTGLEDARHGLHKQRTGGSPGPDRRRTWPAGLAKPEARE